MSPGLRISREVAQKLVDQGRIPADMLQPAKQKKTRSAKLPPVPTVNPFDWVTSPWPEGQEPRCETVVFSLVPPSVNSLFFKKWFVVAKIKKGVKNTADQVLARAKIEPFNRPVILSYTVYRKHSRKCDRDNVCTKWISDCLVKPWGIIQSDTKDWVDFGSTEIIQVEKGETERTVLTITEQTLPPTTGKRSVKARAQ